MPFSYYFLMPDFWQDHIKLVKVHFCWLNYRPIFWAILSISAIINAIFKPQKSYRIGILFLVRQRDLCDEAKLRRADLESIESHIG